MWSRMTLWSGLGAALLGTLLLSTPSEARPPGGGGRGNWSGGRAGWGGSWDGSWNRGWDGNWNRGWYGDGWYGYGWNRPYWNRGYGWYGVPWVTYNDYYFTPDYYPDYTDYGPAPAYSYAQPYAYPSQNGEENDRVILDVRVPPDATVWIEGQKTNQQGTLREFESPPLQPGQTYIYEVQARWMENGRPVNLTRDVAVRAGERRIVDLTTPPTADEMNRAMSPEMSTPSRRLNREAYPAERGQVPPPPDRNDQPRP